MKMVYRKKKVEKKVKDMTKKEAMIEKLKGRNIEQCSRCKKYVEEKPFKNSNFSIRMFSCENCEHWWTYNSPIASGRMDRSYLKE